MVDMDDQAFRFKSCLTKDPLYGIYKHLGQVMVMFQSKLVTTSMYWMHLVNKAPNINCYAPLIWPLTRTPDAHRIMGGQIPPNSISPNTVHNEDEI